MTDYRTDKKETTFVEFAAHLPNGGVAIGSGQTMAEAIRNTKKNYEFLSKTR